MASPVEAAPRRDDGSIADARALPRAALCTGSRRLPQAEPEAGATVFGAGSRGHRAGAAKTSVAWSVCWSGWLGRATVPVPRIALLSEAPSECRGNAPDNKSGDRPAKR